MHAAHLDYLHEIKVRLEAAPHSGRGAIVAAAAECLSCTSNTVYSRLRRIGYDAGRKTRKDRGTLSVDEDLAVTAAGMIKAATRANGKRTLQLTTTLSILKDNGMGVINNETGEVVMPSEATVSRAMRAYGCHPDQIERGAPAQTLRSLHPNYAWEMDASICVLFYLPRGKVALMDEKKYNKNKPHHLEKAAKERVIRWVITDHTSGLIYARYTLGNEDAASALSVLITAMCKREDADDLLHGAPLHLYTDKGAPFVSALTKTFLTLLRIAPIEHARGNARATGQVENAQNIVETHFEGRLRFMEVESIEALNAACTAWCKTWNATAIHSRTKNTRNRVWLTITPEQLRVPESPEALRALVASPPEQRKVKGNLILSYAPKNWPSLDYSLRDIPGIIIGQSIGVSVNPYEAPAVDIIVTARDGSETVYTLQPIAKDRYNFDASAAVIGQEHKAHKDTATDTAIKRMDREAYGADTQKEADAAKRKNARAYSHINAMADVEATAPALYLPKRGHALEVATAMRELPPLSLPEAAQRLRPVLMAEGIAWAEEHMEHLEAAYPDGVPAEAVDALAARFIEAARPVEIPVERQQPALQLVRGAA